MKKLIHSIVFISLLLQGTACSKKEDPVPSIVGVWRQTSQEGSGCTDPTDNFKFNCPADGPCDTYTFILEGNKFTMSNTGIDPVNPLATGTYTISGDKLILKYDDIDYSAESSFVLTATTLTLTRKSDSTGCTITLVYARQ